MKFEADEVTVLAGVRHGDHAWRPNRQSRSATAKWAEVGDRDVCRSGGCGPTWDVARNAAAHPPTAPAMPTTRALLKYGFDDARTGCSSRRQRPPRPPPGSPAGTVARAFLREALGVRGAVARHLHRRPRSPTMARPPQAGRPATPSTTAPVRALRQGTREEAMIAEIEAAKKGTATRSAASSRWSSKDCRSGWASFTSGEKQAGQPARPPRVMGIQAIKGVEIGDGLRGRHAVAATVAHDEDLPRFRVGVMRSTNRAGWPRGRHDQRASRFGFGAAMKAHLERCRARCGRPSTWATGDEAGRHSPGVPTCARCPPAGVVVENHGFALVVARRGAGRSSAR